MFTKLMEFKYVLILAAVISLLLCVIILPMLIPALHKLKFGQSIREDGPKWHKKKSGTPTMGGIAFIVAIVIAAFSTVLNFRSALVVLTALAFGVIGFVDDYIKVVLKRNLGLSAKQKFLLQILVSTIFAYLGVKFGAIESDIYIPFMKGTIDIGIAIIFVSIFIMTGFSNAVNLTDGLDGLATSITAVCSIALGIIAILGKYYDIAIICAAVFGGCIGFLFFNFHPAKVFMGDTGSLFFGGFVAASAIVMKNPIVLLVLGLVYVIETLSVIMQVIYFKKTGKRLFKMSPIHHHFEMCGWSEVKIVCVFTIASVVFGAAAVIMAAYSII